MALRPREETPNIAFLVHFRRSERLRRRHKQGFSGASRQRSGGAGGGSWGW
ncbi:hypothetical protein V6Z11_D13G256800 [Gossypium hirsutum]